MSQQIGFEQLRKILLEQDWEERKELSEKLRDLDSQLNERDRLEERVNPILVDQEDKMKRNFPALFGPQITESIKTQIKESQEEVIEVLYPIIGRMIKKYITNEIEMLSERVDQQMDLAFSWEGWKIRIKAWFTGTPQKELMLSNLIEPKIQEIYVIEKESGIMMGSFSKQEALDKDVVAGMLTAIKAFVEDAFQSEAQELESIDYQNFKIILKSFKSFYIAVVCNGGMTASFKNKLDDELLQFAQQVLANAKNDNEEADQQMIEGGLVKYFTDFDQSDQ